MEEEVEVESAACSSGGLMWSAPWKQTSPKGCHRHHLRTGSRGHPIDDATKPGASSTAGTGNDHAWRPGSAAEANRHKLDALRPNSCSTYLGRCRLP